MPSKRRAPPAQKALLHAVLIGKKASRFLEFSFRSQGILKRSREKYAFSMADASMGEEQALHNLCVSAFTAEYQRDYQNATSLHQSSVSQLSQALQKAGMLDHNKKRVLRRKIKIHQGRLQNLSQQQARPFLLVVPQSRKDMVEEQLRRGVVTIGLVKPRLQSTRAYRLI